jgi:hypothetical protein
MELEDVLRFVLSIELHHHMIAGWLCRLRNLERLVMDLESTSAQTGHVVLRFEPAYALVNKATRACISTRDRKPGRTQSRLGIATAPQRGLYTPLP